MEALLGQAEVMSFSEAANCSRARSYLGVSDSGTYTALFFINGFHTISDVSWKVNVTMNTM